jgi:alpha-N-arabinofuranosidase
MASNSRRHFLKNATLAGAALAIQHRSGRFAFARPETTGPARVILDPSRRVAELDRKLFGSFLEHLGRAIYGGIYEPGSRLADANGFRKDVLEEIKKLGVPIIRYPGGNFVSGYNWLDGVGPKEKRPRVLERAWHSLETNQFGTNEFISWCRAVGTEPLLAVNLGTGTPETAAALVEYCNVAKGTKWSDLRRQHGVEKPHNVKYWCLGNEMDGTWQIGHLSAREYGQKAADAARQMRTIDPSVQLVACGSSGPFMPTYLEWDRQMLEECYGWVDAVSLHRYFNNSNETGGDSSKYLAMNLSMERQIEEMAAVGELIRGRQRTHKQLWLSFDEWNVWYRELGGDGHGAEAPRLLEEVYNLEDALLVGGLINTLLRHADRVRIACLAQLVNVIAPLVTNADGLLRQSTYYPYAWALQYARGYVLDLLTESATYEVAGMGQSPLRQAPGMDKVPYLDVAGTVDAGSGSFTLFILNRDLAKARDLEIAWRENPPTRVLMSETLTGDDLKAFNTFQDPRRVAPRPLEPPKAGARTMVQVPPRSYSVIQWGT